ncbi:MAG: PQQ-binding-like beta-propeller repeat protein [Gammaproteobacteria bacterium]|nr:PQQ-binding-like beta-propeller repeat protein [Gammaproteobacteria bacterium]
MALNPDGSIKWFCGTTGFYGPGSAPAVGADGTIYVNSYDNVHDAISPDGQRLWRYTSGGFVVDVPSSPAIGADGTIYIGHDGVIAALYPDGTPKWTYNTGTYHTAPSIGGDGKIYIGDGTGRVLAFNPDGTLAWSYQTGDGYVRTTPAIGSANRMYVGTGSSVFAFQSP